jgi:hypothetical protein
MKLSLLIAVCCVAALTAKAQVNATQKNNNPSRDGLYIDLAFTLVEDNAFHLVDWLLLKTMTEQFAEGAN